MLRCLVEFRRRLEMLPSSRRFLLLLVLGCVTCLVLIQISSDDKRLVRTTLLLNPAPLPRRNDLNHAEIVHLNTSLTPTQNSSEKKISDEEKSTTLTAMKTITQKISLTSKAPDPAQTTLKQHESHNTTKSIASQVQVRRLPLSKQVPLSQSLEPNLVSRRDRMQEIMKQSNTVRRRTVVDPLRSLKSIPVVDASKVTRIVILTYFRAGSSFFGDILQQNWRTFYHFEPLHSMTYNRRIDDDKISDAFTLLNNIFKCNFSKARDYMQWVRQVRNQFLFAHNLFLWVTCHSSSKVCFHPSFVDSVCQRSPTHVVKVTRLHMRHLRAYLEANPELNIKVVYLTRDPRGIVSSRWSLDWCNGTNCSDSGVLCREMGEDIDIFNALKRQQPSNFIQVRYEDLALNADLEIEKLFQFLRLSFSVSVKKFLKTHTVSRKADDKNPYSTRRNSTSMVSSWRERFSYRQVLDVQSKCGGVLHKLNHSLITSSDQLPYPYGKPKQSSTTKASVVWRYNKNPLAQKYLANKPEFAIDSNPFVNHPGGIITNNSNIEIHKTYKIVNVESENNYTRKSVDLSVSNTIR